MFETVTFPVASCPGCARDVVVGRVLDAQDEWIFVCTRCNHVLPTAASRSLGAVALQNLGYTVEGEIPSAGCGSGESSGCGTCSKTTSCAA